MYKSSVARFVPKGVLIVLLLAGLVASEAAAEGRTWHSVADGTALFIPVVCHQIGSNNTFFGSDVRLFNPGADPVTADLFLSRSGGEPRLHEARIVEAGEVLRLSDLVLSVFALLSAVGTLEIRPSGGALMATARTYNTTAAGAYGQMIAAQPASTAAGPGTVLHLLHLSKPFRYRANVGFCEVAGSETTIRVAMLDDQGEHLGAKEYSLAAYAFHQVNDIFSELAVSARDNVRVTIAATSGQGKVSVGRDAVAHLQPVTAPGRDRQRLGWVGIVKGTVAAAARPVSRALLPRSWGLPLAAKTPAAE